MNQARNMATVLDSGNLNIKYNLEKNQYILSDISKEDIVKIEVAVAIIALIGMIILVVKYKTRGLLAGISYIGLSAVYMLLVRYTNVVISIESIFGIITVLLLNYLFTHNLLENINKIEKENKEDITNKATIATYKQFFVKFQFVLW